MGGLFVRREKGEGEREGRGGRERGGNSRTEVEGGGG